MRQSKTAMSLSIVLLCAVLIRLIIIFWILPLRENTDLLRWKDWARIGYLYDFADTYKPDHITFGTLPNNQPPGMLYIVSMMYQLHIIFAKIVLSLFGQTEQIIQMLNGPSLNFFLRIPALVSDLVTGGIIYWFVHKKKTHDRALVASSLYLFNPAIVYNSALWGQMDAINNMIFLLAVVVFLSRRVAFGFLLYVLSLFVKLSLVFLAPVVLLAGYMSFKKNVMGLLITCFCVFVSVLIFILPISTRPDVWLATFLRSNSLGEMQNTTAFAFNGWWMILRPYITIGDQYTPYLFTEVSLIGSPTDSTKFIGIQMFWWGIGIVILGMLILIYQLRRKLDELLRAEILFLVLANSAFLGFMWLTRMHERYLFPVFGLFCIFFGLTKKWPVFYVVLSVLHIINLYIVWHPMALPFFPYELVNNREFQWAISLGMVVAWTTFYIKSLRWLGAR